MTFAQEIEQVLSDITTVMGRTVTLIKITPGATINASTGARTPTTDSQSLAANLVSTRMAIQAAGQGVRNVEERVYEVQASVITIGTPERGWRLTDGSLADMEVSIVDRDCDDRNYIITTRRTL